MAKRTESTVEYKDTKFKVSKGAPQVILELASNQKSIKSSVDEDVEKFANKGYRALGVAKTEAGSGTWQFVGLVALFDPPRGDSAKTIAAAESMGISVWEVIDAASSKPFSSVAFSGARRES